MYLDCNGFYCDPDFYIEEVSWVDFVRNRQDADVHILVARQSTAAGGKQYALEFRGRGPFEGQTITLQRTTAPDATESMVRDTLVKAVELGLVPFATSTPSAPEVQFRPPAASADTTEPPDPWHRWTFGLSGNAFIQGESQQKYEDEYGSVSAARITDEWKIELSGSGSSFSQTYPLTDTSTYTTRRESYGGYALVVRSLGGHWSAGGVATWQKSTYYNYDSNLRVAPGIEYDVFPYHDSVRRLLTFLYTLGPRYTDYTDVTIYGASSELLLEQQAEATYDVKQPWGSIDTSLRLTHYIARLDAPDQWHSAQYNVDLSGGFDLRLIKGLSLSVNGDIQAVRGQIQLPAVGLTEEQILTQQRELATDYRYYVSVGLSYSFGSIYSSIVNRRFDALD